MRAAPADPAGRDELPAADARGEKEGEARLEDLLAGIPPRRCGCAAYAEAAVKPPYVPALVLMLLGRSSVIA